MKKLLMVLALIANFTAQAGIMTIDVSETTVANGDAITLDILATDFEPLDTFSFRLDLDTTLLGYIPTSLMSDLSFSNPFGFLEVNAFDGYIAFSFLDFDPILTPNFTLASFTLNALNAGNTDFSFSAVEFYQGGFNPVFVDSSNTASVNITEVPEPATWMLLPAMLAFFVRKSSKLK
jgi:hypothetical protein